MGNVSQLQSDKKYTIHEVDAKSSICQLVPTLINKKFDHAGGISDSGGIRRETEKKENNKKENDSILGELVSLTEEGWEQNGWGKYITDTIWNRKEKILILFDLYGYPIEFLKQMDEKTENRKKELAKVYQEFLKEGRKIEKVLFEELSKG